MRKVMFSFVLGALFFCNNVYSQNFAVKDSLNVDALNVAVNQVEKCEYLGRVGNYIRIEKNGQYAWIGTDGKWLSEETDLDIVFGGNILIKNGKEIMDTYGKTLFIIEEGMNETAMNKMLLNVVNCLLKANGTIQKLPNGFGLDNYRGEELENFNKALNDGYLIFEGLENNIRYIGAMDKNGNIVAKTNKTNNSLPYCGNNVFFVYKEPNKGNFMRVH